MAALEELSVNGGGDEGGNKVPRLPRWTRHEILVLIQGKRVAENRVRRGRTAGLPDDSPHPEPKWASVSSYCRRHGVNRGPVQCRKRWSNLAGDFKKIKEWELAVKDDSDSFWVMRNDLRREKKLPGFFDKEVYDILDGTAAAPPPAEILFDSGRTAAPEEGLFSDFDQSGKDASIPAPIPISEKQYEAPFDDGASGQAAVAGSNLKKQAEFGSTSHQGKKRKQCATTAQEDDVETQTSSLQDHLIQVLERNGSILGAHLEAQNTNLKLDREERKDHVFSLLAVLNKLADAMGRIADKL